MVFEHQSLKKYFNHYNRTVLEENWARHNTVGGISGALQLVQNLVLQERVAMPVSNVFFDKFPNLKSLNLTMARMEHPNYCDECKRGVCLTAKDQSIAKILMHWNQLHTTARAIYDEDPANRGSTYDGPLQEAQDKFYYNFFKDVLLRVHSNRSQMRVLVQTLVYIPRQGDVESCYWVSLSLLICHKRPPQADTYRELRSILKLVIGSLDRGSMMTSICSTIRMLQCREQTYEERVCARRDMELQKTATRAQTFALYSSTNSESPGRLV